MPPVKTATQRRRQIWEVCADIVAAADRFIDCSEADIEARYDELSYLVDERRIVKSRKPLKMPAVAKLVPTKKRTRKKKTVQVDRPTRMPKVQNRGRPPRDRGRKETEMTPEEIDRRAAEIRAERGKEWETNEPVTAEE